MWVHLWSTRAEAIPVSTCFTIGLMLGALGVWHLALLCISSIPIQAPFHRGCQLPSNEEESWILANTGLFFLTHNPRWIYTGDFHDEHAGKHTKMFYSLEFSHLKIMKQWRRVWFTGFFLSFCLVFVLYSLNLTIFQCYVAREAWLRDSHVQCSVLYWFSLRRLKYILFLFLQKL